MTMAVLTPPVKSMPIDSSEELPPENNVTWIDVIGSRLKHDTANSVKGKGKGIINFTLDGRIYVK